MSYPFSPRQILCINLSAFEMPLLINQSAIISESCMALKFKSSLDEVRSAMKTSAVDALIVGSSNKHPAALWQELTALKKASPYFPILLLSQENTPQLPSQARALDFPCVIVKQDTSFETLILMLSQAISQTKMHLQDQQQLDQWEMLNQLDKLSFSNQEEIIQVSIEACRRLTQSEVAIAVQLDEDLTITNCIPTCEQEPIASYWPSSLLQEWVQYTLVQKTPLCYPSSNSAVIEGSIFRCFLYPVLEEDKPLCLLILINKYTPYHDRDMLYIRQATNKIWSQIKINQNEMLLRQRLKESEALNRISGTLRQASSKMDFLDSFLAETLSILNTDVGAILLYDEESKRMFSVSARGWIQNIHDIQVHVDHGISGRVFRSGQPLIIENFRTHPDLHPSAWDRFEEGWGGACLPISSSAKVIGIIFLCVQLPKVLTQSEIWLLSTLVEFAGNTLQRLQLSSDLEKTKSNLAWEDKQLANLMDILSKDRELLNITLMAIGEGVITLNEQYEITLINREAEIITGYSAQDVMGRHINAILTLIDPKTDQPIPDALDHLHYLDQMEKGGVIHNPPLLLNKLNSKKLITGNISPIFTSEGIKTGSVMIIKDITERSELESQMSLLKKMEAIGQLATGIAHEINTPIQYINENLMYIQRGFNQIRHLIEQGEKILNQVPHERKGFVLSEVELESLNEFNLLLENRNTRHYLEEIPNAVNESLEGIEKVRKIILAIREFSHPSDHEKKFSDLNHAIQNILTISKNQWKHIAMVELDLEADLPLVCCRVDEINQALLNMIINAAQAIESNPIRTPEQMGVIGIKTWHSAANVFVSIQDSGCGIDPHAIDRIFDPFFTTKEVGHGTGQGLFITHTIIVKKHQGLITVESKRNEGTVFTIQLPINNASV